MNTPALLDPLPSRALTHGIPPSRSLKRPKLALLKSRAVNPTYCPASSTRDPELHHLIVTAAKAALSLHISNQSFFVCKHKVHKHTLPRWLLHHLHQKVIISALKEPPGLCVPSCLVFPAGIRVAEVPRENQGLGSRGCFQLSVEGLISFLFLIR